MVILALRCGFATCHPYHLLLCAHSRHAPSSAPKPTTDAAAEAGEGVAHPTLHGKEQPGLFTRAVGAAEELAASAAGKLKHGAQLATGKSK